MTLAGLLAEIIDTAQSVTLAVLPLALFFFAFQSLVLRLPRTEISRIIIGTLLASAGLFLFLLGVSIGFLPFGRAIGETAGSWSRGWLLLPFGFVLGFVTTWGEPAVRILADQVEDASAGAIPRALVLYAVCLGVAVAVGVGLFRIGYGINLLWLLVPGYLIAMVLLWVSDRSFVSIAIDAGGVATGPLANTFLLALALGTASSRSGSDVLVQGLGLVSLIALAPILSVMSLGLLVRMKAHKESSS